MSITRCRHLAVLVVCGCLPAVLPLFGMDVQKASPPPSSAQVQPYSDATAEEDPAATVSQEQSQP